MITNTVMSYPPLSHRLKQSLHGLLLSNDSQLFSKMAFQISSEHSNARKRTPRSVKLAKQVLGRVDCP